MSTGTVVITGGAGFIGNSLCADYLRAGYHVICVDNFLSGTRENLSQFKNNPDFRLIEHDVTEPIAELYQIDDLAAILHFASPASPNPASPVSYMAHPIETLLVNSLGTKNMLDLATDKKCQIILASTSEVYGDPLVHPQTEDYNGNVSPNGPRSCYDEGKRFMEAVSFAYYRTRETRIKIIRIFNTYGPGMRLDEGRFVPSLVDSIVNSKPFRRLGDGTATRSFCYVSDLVDGIHKVFTSDGMIGEVVNLGNPEELSINDAISIAEDVSGRKVEIIAQPALADDPGRRKPDISKAKRLLGWEPTVKFRDGITRMVQSYAEK